MATQNIVASGGRASGGVTITPDTVQRQQANNTLPNYQQRADDSGSGGPALPILDADAIDRLFAQAGIDSTSQGEGNRETGEAAPARQKDPNVIGALGSGKRGFNSPDSPYAKLGWDLGWNSMGTGIRRGAAAFGLTENSAYNPGGGENGGAGAGSNNASKYTNLLDIASKANVDVNQYRDASGRINEDALRVAVDDSLKDYYFVSGDTGGISGYSGAQPFKFASGLYKRDGTSLKPISGTERTFMAPENSVGHWNESSLGSVVGILAAPLLSGMGVLGQGGSLATGIANTTGMSPFWSNVLGNALVRGGMTAAGGGNFLQGALAGGVTAGATPYIAQGASELAGTGTTGAALLGGAGNVLLQAALNGGTISPMGAVSTILSQFGKKPGTGRTR